MAAIWQAKQEEEPGTALPGSFPFLSKLQAAGYKTSEDLDGADATEMQLAGLSLREAEAAIAAFAKL